MKKSLTGQSSKLDNTEYKIVKTKGRNMKRVVFEVTLPFAIKKKAEYWITSCPPLDLFAQGKNETEAKKNLETTVRLFLTSCFESGVLDSVLKSCGFTVERNIRQAKQDKTASITVPLYLLSPSRCFAECRA